MSEMYKTFKYKRSKNQKILFSLPRKMVKRRKDKVIKRKKKKRVKIKPKKQLQKQVINNPN